MDWRNHCVYMYVHVYHHIMCAAWIHMCVHCKVTTQGQWDWWRRERFTVWGKSDLAALLVFIPNFWRALSNVVMRSALWGENRKGWGQVEAVWGCDGHGSGGNRQIKAFRRHRGRYAHDEPRVLLNRGIQKPIASWGMELVQVRSLNRGILEQHRWKNTFFLDCLAQAQFHRTIRIC